MADKKNSRNTFTVVGTLKQVEYKNKEKQAEQVSSRATVESVIGGKTKTYEIEFFSKAVTQAGTPNKLYATYLDMEKNIGKKIKITGELRENRYYSSTKEAVVSTNVLSGRFVNYDVKDSDIATFGFDGFVIRALSEKKNKDEEIYQYNISVAQEGYKEGSLVVINFNVSVAPEDMAIVDVIRDRYSVGSSVQIDGDLDFYTETTVSEVNREGGFGKPIVREYTNTYRNYFITSGSAPILSDDEKAFYNDEKINALVQAYKANDVELEKAAKEKENTTTPAQSTAPAAKPAVKRTGSLI